MLMLRMMMTVMTMMINAADANDDAAASGVSLLNPATGRDRAAGQARRAYLQV